MTADGKQLPINEFWKRAKPGTVIALATAVGDDQQAVLAGLRPDTLVIIPMAVEKKQPLPMDPAK